MGNKVKIGKSFTRKRRRLHDGCFGSKTRKPDNASSCQASTSDIQEIMQRTRRITFAQVEELVSWMEDHPQQAKGVDPSFDRQQIQQIDNLWDELASRLNVLEDGVNKTVKEWQTYWNDQKHKARRKKILIDSGHWITSLTAFEERIMALAPDLEYEIPNRKSSRTCVRPKVRASPREPAAGQYATLIVTPLPSGTITSSQNLARPQLDEPLQKLDRCDYIAKVWAETLRTLPNTQRILAEKIMNDVFFEAQLTNLTRDSHLQVENMEHHQVENVENVENAHMKKEEDPFEDTD